MKIHNSDQSTQIHFTSHSLLFPVQVCPVSQQKTTVVRNSTVEKEQIKHPLVPSHSSPKCIHLGLTCLSKTHAGETGIVQCTPEWDNRVGALPGAQKRPEAWDATWYTGIMYHVCLSQEAAIPACNRVGLRFLWVIPKQYCPSFQQVLQVPARAVPQRSCCSLSRFSTAKGKERGKEDEHFAAHSWAL